MINSPSLADGPGADLSDKTLTPRDLRPAAGGLPGTQNAPNGPGSGPQTLTGSIAVGERCRRGIIHAAPVFPTAEERLAEALGVLGPTWAVEARAAVASGVPAAEVLAALDGLAEERAWRGAAEA